MNTLPAFEEACAALVAAPSVSCLDPAYDQSNRAVVDLLADWMDELGFSIEIMPVDRADRKVNLIATLGQGDDGLVLSGHTDTVPFNEAAWHQDPFRLTARDNRFYGLGVTDMKCFFAIVIQALQTLELKQLKRPLILLATCDEESAMSGARALAEANRRLGRYALIGEPTGLQPIIMHKGTLIETIMLKGQAGHSSNPSLGNNALDGMHKVMQSLLAWRAHLRETYSDQNFAVAFPTLNFGCIRGGDSPNRICADCELKIDLRVLPGMQVEELREQLRQTVTQAVADSGLKLGFDEVFPGIPPMKTSPHSEIVRVVEQLTGHDAGAVSFATEGPYLNALGMDTVILGPGNIEQAHQANEYLDQDRIQPMQALLEKIIMRFCA